MRGHRLAVVLCRLDFPEKLYFLRPNQGAVVLEYHLRSVPHLRGSEVFILRARVEKAPETVPQSIVRPIERPIMDDKPPGILTVEQAVALLANAVETRVEMVAGVSIGLFGGLRRSEICALDWSEI